MVTRDEALLILNREKNYEDKLICDLANYFLANLDDIPDITLEEKSYIHKNLMSIISDSLGHSQKFGDMILMVLENGESDKF